MQDYMFVSGTDDGLYDTREINWAHQKPLRAVYRKHYRRIRNLEELKACLRAGKYTDLGGYPLYFVSLDGATLSYAGVIANWERVVWDCMTSYRFPIVGMEVNYGEELYCDYTGKRIDSFANVVY